MICHVNAIFALTALTTRKLLRMKAIPNISN